MKNLYLLLVLLGFSFASQAQVIVSGKVTRTNGDSVKGARVYIRSDSSSGQPVFTTISDTTNNSGNFSIPLSSNIPSGTVFYVSTLNCDSVNEVSNTHIFTGNSINSPLKICVTPPTNFSGYVFLGDSIKRPQPQQAVVYLIARCASNVLTYIDSVETDTNGYYQVDSFPKLAAGCELIMKARLKATAPNYKKYLPAYHESNGSYKLRWSGARDVPYTFAKGGVSIILPEAKNPFGGPSVLTGYAVDDNANILPGKVIFLTDGVDVTVNHTYTDATGYFSFDNLPFGRYKLFGDVWGKDNPDLVVNVDAEQVNIYNIIFTENNNKFEGRLATSVSGAAEFSSLQLFPNPADNMVFIKGSEKLKGNKQVVITTVTGKLVFDQAFSPGKQIQIPLHNIQPGIYLLEVETVNGRAKFKLVK